MGYIDGMSLYTFVEGDPADLVDPMGTSVELSVDFTSCGTGPAPTVSGPGSLPSAPAGPDAYDPYGEEPHGSFDTPTNANNVSAGDAYHPPAPPAPVTPGRPCPPQLRQQIQRISWVQGLRAIVLGGNAQGFGDSWTQSSVAIVGSLYDAGAYVVSGFDGAYLDHAAQHYYSGSVIAQADDLGGGYKYGTYGALGVSGAAATLALGVGTYEFAALGNESIMVEGVLGGGRMGSGGLMQLRVPGEPPIVRLDFHPFGGTGGTPLPHIDSPPLGLHHWPWEYFLH